MQRTMVPHSQLEDEIRTFIRDGTPPKSLRAGSGHFLWQLHSCWSNKARKRGEMGHTLKNLASWIQQTRIDGITSITGLQHKLKGRASVSAAEVKVLITIFLLFWDTDGKEHKRFGRLTRTNIMEKAATLTECVLGDKEVATISNDVRVKSSRDAAIYRLDVGDSGFRLETILAHISSRRPIVLSLTDLHQVLKDKVEIVPLAIQPLPRNHGISSSEVAIHAVLSPLDEDSTEVFILLPTPDPSKS